MQKPPQANRLRRFSVLGKGNDVSNAAMQGGADAIQQKAVVARDGVLVIFVDDGIADPRQLIQLIARNAVPIQILL